MTTKTGPVPTLTPSFSAPDRPGPLPQPGRGRRAALAVAGFLACALPTVFTVNISRMLLTGELSEHRFHQATGQGLILFALWLVPLIGLLRAGWAGRRPSAALGWMHLTFATTGVGCAAVAPGGGAPFLVGVVVITGALVWSALPRRPRLRTRLQLDAVTAVVVLVSGSVLVPYVIDQLAAQNAVSGGHHAQNPHLFDQAWLTACLFVLGVLAAVLPAGRGLLGWLVGGAAGLGMAGLVFGEGTTWSLLVLGVALVAAAGSALPRLRDSDRVPS